ncbi:MAG: gamma-glutamylcyclotransferase [Clostridiales bacterium]|nr:gamma-glutamylcyclotransferase [Clostridiales bacterium]
MRKLYIAYGSNLNVSQMAHRCPTARIYGVGILHNWELIYRGSKTGAYATIRRKKGSAVPVVVWTIAEADERRLDIYEGFPTFYFKQNIMVDLPFGKKKAMVYIMNTRAKPGRPSAQYVRTVKTGYIDNNLDLGYLEESLLKNNVECDKKDAQFS